jgi:hypothetical protein
MVDHVRELALTTHWACAENCAMVTDKIFLLFMILK